MEDNPLRLALNPSLRNLTYLWLHVQALDSPCSCCSACCHDYPFQSCSNDIPVLKIQPWITSDPVIPCVLAKLSLVRKKYLQTFKTMWYCILIFCKKDCYYIDHTIKSYLFINLFIYQLIYRSIYLRIYSSPYLFIISLVL